MFSILINKEFKYVSFGNYPLPELQCVVTKTQGKLRILYERRIGQGYNIVDLCGLYPPHHDINNIQFFNCFSDWYTDQSAVRFRG